MTRKKIGIYCTAIWGNNNKTHHRCCRPLLPALDPRTCGPPLDGRTDETQHGTNVLSQPTDAGNVQGNMATGTRSASKCSQRTQQSCVPGGVAAKVPLQRCVGWMSPSLPAPAHTASCLCHSTNIPSWSGTGPRSSPNHGCGGGPVGRKRGRPPCKEGDRPLGALAR